MNKKADMSIWPVEIVVYVSQYC